MDLSNRLIRELRNGSRRDHGRPSRKKAMNKGEVCRDRRSFTKFVEMSGNIMRAGNDETSPFVLADRLVSPNERKMLCYEYIWN